MMRIPDPGRQGPSPGSGSQRLAPLPFSPLAVAVGVFIATACSAFREEEPPMDYLDDLVVASRARNALGAEPSLERVEVSVRDATARLSGVVSSDRERERAEEIVGQLAGVREVANEIRVETSSERDGGKDEDRGGGTSGAPSRESAEGW